jgi:uncharacterized membrane protein YgaE (UPF0421/DUF939 family)
MLVSLLAYYAAYYLTEMIVTGSVWFPVGPLWAVIVGIVVIQPTGKSTVQRAGFQVLGGLVGTIVSLVYLIILPFSPVLMAIVVGLAVLLCCALNRPEYSAPAALTVAVILIFSHINPDLSPFMNAGLRFSEVLIGTLVAILVVRLLPDAGDQTG